MGADLYIRKIQDTAKKKNQPAFEKATKVRDGLWKEAEATLSKKEIARMQNWFNFQEFAPGEKMPVLRGKVKRWAEMIQVAQKQVNQCYNAMYNEDAGYFRDSYNASSVLWAIGLSWWGDVGSMLNTRGNLTPQKARELVVLIKSKKMKPITKKYLQKQHAQVDDGENSPVVWRKYYQEKRQKLIDFLNLAIRLRTPVHCSI